MAWMAVMGCRNLSCHVMPSARISTHDTLCHAIHDSHDSQYPPTTHQLQKMPILPPTTGKGLETMDIYLYGVSKTLVGGCRKCRNCRKKSETPPFIGFTTPYDGYDT